jgi:hypothetical protein
MAVYISGFVAQRLGMCCGDLIRKRFGHLSDHSDKILFPYRTRASDAPPIETLIDIDEMSVSVGVRHRDGKPQKAL